MGRAGHPATVVIGLLGNSLFGAWWLDPPSAHEWRDAWEGRRLRLLIPAGMGQRATVTRTTAACRHPAL